MKLLRSLRGGNIFFLNITINLFLHNKSQGKFKDKDHLKLHRYSFSWPDKITTIKLMLNFKNLVYYFEFGCLLLNE